MLFLPKIPAFENPLLVQKDLHLFAKQMFMAAAIMGVMGMLVRQTYLAQANPDALHVYLRMALLAPVLVWFFWNAKTLHSPISHKYKWTTIVTFWGIVVLGKAFYGLPVIWAAPLLLFTFVAFPDIPPLRPTFIRSLTLAIAAALIALMVATLYLKHDLGQAPLVMRHALWATGITVIFGLQWSRLLRLATALQQVGADRDVHLDKHADRQTLRYTLMTAAAIALLLIVITPWFDPHWSVLLKSNLFLPLILFFLVAVFLSAAQAQTDRTLEILRWSLVSAILISALAFTDTAITDKQAGTMWLFAALIALSTSRWRATLWSACLLLWGIRYAQTDPWTQTHSIVLIGSLCAGTVMFFMLRCADRIEIQLTKHTLARQTTASAVDTPASTKLGQNPAVDDIQLEPAQMIAVALIVALTAVFVGLASYVVHHEIVSKNNRQALILRDSLLKDISTSVAALNSFTQITRSRFEESKKMDAVLKQSGSNISIFESALRQQAKLLLTFEPSVIEVQMETDDGFKLNVMRQGQDITSWPQNLADGKEWVLHAPRESDSAHALHISWRLDPDAWLRSPYFAHDQVRNVSLEIALNVNEDQSMSPQPFTWSFDPESSDGVTPRTNKDRANLRISEQLLPMQGLSVSIKTWLGELGLHKNQNLLFALEIGLVLMLFVGFQTQQYFRVKLRARRRRVQEQQLAMAQAESTYLLQQTESLAEINQVKSRQAAILEALPLAFCELYFSAEGDALIRNPNPAFLKLTGLPETPAQSQTTRYLDLLETQDRLAVEGEIKNARQHQQARQFNCRYLVAGKVRHVHVLISPLQDNSGSVFWSSVALDITDRVLDAARIHRLSLDNELMAEFARHTTNAVFFTDAQGNITWMNAGASEVSGIRIDEAIGKPYQDVFSAGGQAANPGLTAQNWYLQSNDTVFELACVNKKTQRAFWLNVNMHAKRGKHDRLLGTLAVATDITETKSINAMLEEVNKKLNESLLEAKASAAGKA